MSKQSDAGTALKECLASIRETAHKLHELKNKHSKKQNQVRVSWRSMLWCGVEIVYVCVFVCLLQNEFVQEASKGAALFTTLKQLNREVFLDNESQKEDVSNEKQYTDDCELQLENLKYEEAHLNGQIRKCTELPMPHFESLDLVSEQELFTAKPETKQDLGQLPEYQRNHKILTARLAHELELRNSMKEKVNETQKQQQDIQKHIEEKTHLMSSLPTEVEHVEQATKNLQKYLGVETTASIQQVNEIQKLPRPLFVLYRQLQSAKDQLSRFMEYDSPDTKRMVDAILDDLKNVVKSTSISIEIKDSVSPSIQKEPTQFASFLFQASHETSEANETPRKRQKTQSRDTAKSSELPQSTLSGAGKTTPSGKAEDSKFSQSTLDYSTLFSPSEKCIVVHVQSQTVHDKELGEQIRFQYLPYLDVVTAECLSSSTNSKLSNLYPGDSGVETPTLLHHMMDDQGIAHLNEILTFPDDIGGRPFHWAQWLCGIYSAKAALSEDTDDVIQASTLDVLHRIIKRNIYCDAFNQDCQRMKQEHKNSSGLIHPIIDSDLFKQRNGWEPLHASSTTSRGHETLGKASESSAEIVDFVIVSKGAKLVTNSKAHSGELLETMTTLDDYFSDVFDKKRKVTLMKDRLLSFYHSVQSAAMQLSSDDKPANTSAHDVEDEEFGQETEVNENTSNPPLASSRMVERLISSAYQEITSDWRYFRPRYLCITYQMGDEVVQMLLQIPSEYPDRLPRMLIHRLPPKTSAGSIWLDDYMEDVPGDLRLAFKKFGDDILRETAHALRQDESKELCFSLISRMSILMKLTLPSVYKRVMTS